MLHLNTFLDLFSCLYRMISKCFAVLKNAKLIRYVIYNQYLSWWVVFVIVLCDVCILADKFAIEYMYICTILLYKDLSISNNYGTFEVTDSQYREYNLIVFADGLIFRISKVLAITLSASVKCVQCVIAVQRFSLPWKRLTWYLAFTSPGYLGPVSI